MAGPARNRPCPCGSGVKYKKCCGRDESPLRPVRKPAYSVGAERDPEYWRALQRARNRFAKPTVAWEDPRTVAAMLGLPQRSGVALRRPPHDADFEWLIAHLTQPGGDDAIHVRRVDDELAIAFALDDGLLAAVKRIPGRRFDARLRAWMIPADSGAVAAARRLLAEHPWLTISADAHAWLEEAGSRWTGCVSVTEHDGEPMLILHAHDGEPPSELVDCAVAASDDVLVVPALAPAAAGLHGMGGLEPDDVAEAVLAAAGAGTRPAGGSLTLGRDDDRQPRLELRTDWLLDAAEAFADLPEAEAVTRRDRSCRYELQDVVLALPADPSLASELRELLDGWPDLHVDAGARRCLEELEAERERAAATVALSRAHDAELAPVTLGGELRPFQRAGVRYALAQRRTFIADEQGLGKTIEALAALELDGAFPAVVVCPASMKLVWRQECEQWLPERRVAVLDGRSARGWTAAGAADAELVICNYDIVEAHAERLEARGLRAAVFDESHYCKEPRRKRTQAAIRVSDAVAPDGLRLALTGTPIMNRPRELVSQLRLIGRLGDFGSGAALGRRFRGRDAHDRLHWHLRAHCYARRTKAEVLPQLPAKRVATVPLALDNPAEYRLAEADVVAWLRTLPLDLGTLEARVAATLRAEQLARCNYLRRLVARGKLASASDWIADFVASGEPLVVFAHHREVQQALLGRFPEAVHVLGDDDSAARAAAVSAFQRSDGPSLIVCSLHAGAQGITLTRASNVAFLELDWTPARHDQAEDRCHRIGQESAVTAYYLLAPGTLDEHMAGVLHRKRGVIEAVTDGRGEGGATALDEVVHALRDDPGAAELRAAA